MVAPVDSSLLLLTKSKDGRSVSRRHLSSVSFSALEVCDGVRWIISTHSIIGITHH